MISPPQCTTRLKRRMKSLPGSLPSRVRGPDWLRSTLSMWMAGSGSIRPSCPVQRAANQGRKSQMYRTCFELHLEGLIKRFFVRFPRSTCLELPSLKVPVGREGLDGDCLVYTAILRSLICSIFSIFCLRSLASLMPSRKNSSRSFLRDSSFSAICFYRVVVDL